MKPKKYALSIEILLNIPNKPTFLRELSKAEVNKKMKEYTDIFVGHGIRFTVTEDWVDFED